MGVHHVQGHLDRIEPEVVAGRGLKHLYVELRVLMAGKADIADFSLTLCVDHGLQCTTLSKDPVRIVSTDNFMELQEINMIGLESRKRFVDLAGGRDPVAAVNLCHQECPLRGTRCGALSPS